MKRRTLRASLAVVVVLASGLVGPPPPAAAGGSTRIAVVADICNPPDQAQSCKLTGDLIRGDASVAKVITAGDNQYEAGELADYQRAFAVSFAPGLSILPAPGNHDPYDSGYRSYFSVPQRYTARIGDWLFISVDSNSIDESAGFISRALHDDRSHRCEAVFFHHPRYSSGAKHGDQAQVEPLYAAAADNGADVIFNGHDHIYERYSPQRGVVEYIVGTGGEDLRGLGSIDPASAFEKAGSHGALFVDLGSRGWSSFFKTVDGTVVDRASGRCR
jgi:acid phosphatase type 7